MKSRALSLTDKTRYSFKGSEIRTNSVLQHEAPSRSKATVTDWRNRWRQKYKWDEKIGAKIQILFPSRVFCLRRCLGPIRWNWRIRNGTKSAGSKLALVYNECNILLWPVFVLMDRISSLTLKWALPDLMSRSFVPFFQEPRFRMAALFC